MTDRETLVERVALAIQLADECEIPDDYSLGLDPKVSDWGAFLANDVINLIMEEAAKIASEWKVSITGVEPISNKHAARIASSVGPHIAAALRAYVRKQNC